MNTEFDKMTREFTMALFVAAGWKHRYFGATYSTRIREAIKDLKRAIKKAEENPEIGKVDVE